MFPEVRMRRLRRTQNIRKMVQEVQLNMNDYIYPIFVIEGTDIKNEIPSMPGIYQFSLDHLLEEVQRAVDAGVIAIMLFGIPEHKDACGSGAWAEDGIVQKAFRKAKETVPELYLIGDVCMCEYTSHGHCGILDGEYVDNDKTLEYLAKIALSQVQAGADMVAPSDMMDGRVAAIRRMLDENGYCTTPIMSYAAKYASGFYGPFRDAADSAPAYGDRKTYQMDYHNRKEAMKEVFSDLDEGADIIMIKPALSYLDIIRETADAIDVPVAAYSVSGEYSLIKAAGKLGSIEEEKLICETAASIYRAGCNILLTYFAKELAGYMDRGLIG